MTRSRRLALAFALSALSSLAASADPPAAASGVQKDAVAVTLSGGHDTDPRDRGRPVVLVAAGLGVPADVFREAFSHVRPAPAGHEPDPQQVRRNKEALLDALGKYGVTNDRLDTVSNTYRYRPGGRELWTHADAVVTATVADGKVTGFEIKTAGAGYTTPPKVSIPGFPKLTATVTLHFDTDLTKNGSIESVKLTPAPASTQP